VRTDSRPADLPFPDEALAGLVDELASRLQAGESVDGEELARAHPEHAERLGSLLPTLRALAALRTPDESDSGAPVTGVLGDFQIVREVGRGGMGVVYEARQLSLGGRRVALKVLPFAGMYDPRHLVRFQNEARAAACLHHPHIIPVYAVGSDEGVHYYAMQFIDGPSLAAAIDEIRVQHQGTRTDNNIGAGAGSETPPDETAHLTSEATAVTAALSTERTSDPRAFVRTVARLGAQAAAALDHAHQQGVVHRDVKPANLLLDGDRNLWVTDFGVAHIREEGGVTRSGEIIGTLRYMSPEQAHGHGPVDHRTDVYSLGVTLYELLTLRQAFPGDVRHELLNRIATEEPPLVRQIDPALPRELETIIAKGMSKVPAERYATARELGEDLQRWLDDKPILARPPGPVQRLRKWARRHRSLVVGMAASLALLTVGVVIGSIWYAVQQRALADEQKALADEERRLGEQKERSEREIAAKWRLTLIGRADAVRLGRRPGYRREVWADLREAARIPASASSADQVRTIIFGCLGDPVGLEPVENPAGIPVPKRAPVPADVEKRIRAVTAGPIFPTPRTDQFAVIEKNRLIHFYGTDGRKTPTVGYSSLGAIYDLTVTPHTKPDEKKPDEYWTVVAGCEQGFFVWAVPLGPGLDERWVVAGGNVSSVAVSPNGRFLATGGQQLELWSLATSRPVFAVPAPVPGARVGFSADGRILLALVNGTAVAGWHVSDTPERRVFDGHTKGVPGVAFRPGGGGRVVSVSKDELVRVWDTATGEIVGGEAPIRHTYEIEAVAFSADGSRFATGDFGGVVRVWDANSRALLAEVNGNRGVGRVWRVQFTHDGKWVVAAGARGVGAWQLGPVVADKLSLTELRTIEPPAGARGVVDLAVRPGRLEVVFTTLAGQLYSLDLSRADAQPRLLTSGARGALRSLNFTPRGDRVTFITGANTFGWWDFTEEKVIDTGLRAEHIALDADGRRAALGVPGARVTVVDVASGKEIFALPPEGADVWSMSWSGDGKRLAVGLSDGRVALWDLEQVSARLAEFGVSSQAPLVPE
jgi:serine/threonine protein kinase/WD40 repeat protein